MQVSIPSYDELFNPTLQALQQLGGSGKVQEIDDKVAAILDLSDEQIAAVHRPGKSNQTQISYRLGWARSYLKKYGLIDNSQWGVWSLTQRGQQTPKVDTKQVKDAVVAMAKKERQNQSANETDESQDSEGDFAELGDDSDGGEWRETLFAVLTDMDPIAFERLCQRVLRESGFTQVEVTKASHDGGIDGKGILQVNDFLSFRVVFQCKRYTGTVGPEVVQRLRGAMPGSADRGLIVTTGNFTKNAIREATREDHKPIELVDGTQLMDKLKDLSLGVKTEEVVSERVTVNPDFFANI